MSEEKKQQNTEAMKYDTVLATVDYYKKCPFEKGKIYNEGIYIGRYDAWDNYFGAFLFECNGRTEMIHPKDIERIEATYLL